MESLETVISWAHLGADLCLRERVPVIFGGALERQLLCLACGGKIEDGKWKSGHFGEKEGKPFFI